MAAPAPAAAAAAAAAAPARRGGMADEELEPMERNMRNILEQESLRWIFVGGKGGVGKTTTSSSLAVQLAQRRKSVLIISTDPAHNLSDAFGQKFGKSPTRVNGFDNLFAMEVDPTVEIDTGDAVDAQSKSFITELFSSLPGIDEAMSFAELFKLVQMMNYSCIVFDTAPTGHTLRLLSFPSLLERAFGKMMSMRDKFGGIFNQMQQLMADSGTSEEQILSRIEAGKQVVSLINRQFQDPNLTTFVCVCIPEFLSLFETERLVQELTKYRLDTHNIVVNQVLMPEKGSTCKKCAARVRMQSKYLAQILDLYEDFNVTVMPQLDDEVRGVQGLLAFGRMLLDPPKPEQ